jgi:uncharacterized cupin superfamily protein
MEPVRIRKPTREELAEMGVSSWPIWEKEASEFPWFYDETETCYVLAGRVRVTPDEGEPVEFGPGDLVTFPKGMGCTWEVKEPIRKHYRFG